LVKNPSIYVLGDQHVVVFELEMDGHHAKAEYLFDEGKILDYTIEFNGPIEIRDNLLNLAFEEAKKLIKQHITLKK